MFSELHFSTNSYPHVHITTYRETNRQTIICKIRFGSLTTDYNIKSPGIEHLWYLISLPKFSASHTYPYIALANIITCIWLCSANICVIMSLLPAWIFRLQNLAMFAHLVHYIGSLSQHATITFSMRLSSANKG